jgi:cytochrome oxidase Cu insertion factor (SCO1/SenC/PrrC family)
MHGVWGSAPALLALAFTMGSCGKTQKTSTPSAGQGLQIGQPAPEIEGNDLDGQPFKLSDYRGQIVVLAFWGDW